MRCLVRNLIIWIVLTGSARAWTPAAPVWTTGHDSLDCRTAVDANGKIYAVWREDLGGSNWQIWYTHNTSGTFITPMQLSSGATDAYSPVVAANGTDAHVAWTTDPAGNNNFEIFYRKTINGTFGSTLNASNTSIKSLRPALAIRGSVGPMIAFDEALQADDRYDTFFVDWNGSGFTSAINISNTPGGSAYGSVNVNIVVAASGDVTAVWVDRDNAQNEYHPNARRRVNGVWQARQEIATLPLGPSTPGLAAGPDNSVHTVYESGGTIWYQRWSGAGWTAAAALPGGLNNPLRCKIAMDDRNIAHVVCDDSHFGVGEIRYSTNASGSWSAWANISNTPNTNSTSPDIGYAANTVVAIWMENSNQAGGTGVFNTWYARLDVPPPGPSGSMIGTVQTSTQAPVTGAVVSCGGRDTLTAADGTYTLTQIPVGTYTASAAKLLYNSDAQPGVSIVSNQITTVNFVIDPSPPGPVTGFSVVASNTANTLYWTNPVTGNFSGTMLRVSTTGFPAGTSDGALVIDQAGSLGSNDTYTQTGLTNGLTYYYTAIAHDSSGGAAGGVNAGPARPAVAPDFDRDGDVDQIDFGHLQLCLSGPNLPQFVLACSNALLDGDSDVDADDLSLFLNCKTGSSVYANPACSD